MPKWAPFSVYTVRDSTRLADQCAAGGPHRLTEGKRWVSGHRLWAEGRREQVQTAVIFSAAEADKGLIYWGVIDDIEVDDDGTTCTYSQLRPIMPAEPISTLRLRSTGRLMSEANIRPYAICHTPSFVR